MGGNPPSLFGQPQRKLESIRQISVMLPLSSISASTARLIVGSGRESGRGPLVFASVGAYWIGSCRSFSSIIVPHDFDAQTVRCVDIGLIETAAGVVLA